MKKALFQTINSMITCQEPVKSFIVCFIYSNIIMVLIILIGGMIDKLETLQMKLLNKFVTVKASEFICNRLTFPGIMVHELSHAVFASMLGAKVTKIKLISLRQDGRLGWIEYQTRGKKILQGLQLSWSACAPTIMGAILETMIIHIFSHAGIFSKVILIYFMISIADHMSMSKQDILNYIHGSWAFCGILYVILLILRLM